LVNHASNHGVTHQAKQPATSSAYPRRSFHGTWILPPVPVEEFNMTTKNRLAIQWLVCGFSLVLPASAQTYKIIYAFNGQNSLTAGSTIANDKVGNLYGASTFGGTQNCAQGPCGAIYKIDPEGKETTLYEFKGPPDGANPMAVTVPDDKGVLYGTTEYGGTSTFQYCGGGCGTVFELNPGGEMVLHSFDAPPSDGILPQAGVIAPANGALYGTTTFGGSNSAYGNPGEGTIYTIANNQETVLYNFTGGDDGGLPSAALLAHDDALYGTAEFGGSGPCVTIFGDGCGTVFKVAKNGETTLWTFQDGPDGASPAASLIADKSGNLYGTTVLGGDLNCNLSPGNPPGCGVVFKLSPSGDETVLHTFTDSTDGAWPSDALVMDATGNLYGTAFYGGDLSCNGIGCGTVFKIDTAGNFTVLHTFESSDGAYPRALIAADGKLYGVATGGGPANDGVVYEITP
jgi:uncharacterized repeat protein (TIGR03803 family)